jgi:hypothetical protein
MEASIGEVLVSILVQFQIGEFDVCEKRPPRHEPVNLSQLPLIEKAKEWGIKIKTVPRICKCHGHYDKNLKEIHLVTVHAKSYLHGLAHAAIERYNDPATPLKPESEEILAELAAVALYQIVTQKPDKRLANSYAFILLNSVALNKTAMEACMELFAETEEIIESILA